MQGKFLSIIRALTKTQWLLLGCIMLVATVLRFYRITEQGFLYWDEGMYMNEAKFYASVFHHIPFVWKQIIGGVNVDAITATLDGWPPSAGKPLHGLIIFIFSLIIGLQDYTGQVTSAVFSVGTMLLLFYAIFKYDNVVTALVTLCIIACSPHNIMFARSAFAEMDSIFFYVLSLLLYMRSYEDKKHELRNLMFAGIVFAISLTTNFRWFMLIPTFVFFDVFIYARTMHNGWMRVVKRLLCLYVGAMVLVLCIDCPYIVIGKTIALPSRFSSFHEQLVFYVRTIAFAGHKTGLFCWRFLYMQLYMHFVGVLQCVCVLCGTLFVLKNTKVYFVRMAAIIFWFLLIGLSLVKNGQFARYNSVMYPFGAYIAACGIVGLARRISASQKVQRGVVVVLVCLLAGRGLVYAQKFVFVQSGYREAMQYLQEHGGEKHLSPTNSVSEFYFGRNVPNLLHRRKEDFLRAMESDDYKYLLVDYAQYYVRNHVGVTPLYRFLSEQCTPVKIIPNPMGNYQEIVLESLHYLNAPQGEYEEVMSDPHTNEIRIYSTEGLHEAVKELVPNDTV